MTISEQNKQDFIAGYLEAALWSSTDERADPLTGRHYTVQLDEYEWAPGEAEKLHEDCLDFITSEEADLLEYVEQITHNHDRANAWSGAGHDFWLTRNHHGAGYWDRGLDDLGDRLTRAAQVYGGIDLYLGDDELVYGV